jgi:uncharacterized membrane protein (UPF0127 family)
MRHAYLLSVAIILVIFVLSAIFIYFQGIKAPDPTGQISMVCITGKCFGVEVVDTPATRSRGLMFRESLDQNKGMLFVYDEEGMYHFWMKNTLIPLDMIWIGQDMRIVNIARNAQPCTADPCPTYNPGGDAMYILEINGGLSERRGFVIGEEVEFL